MPASVSAVASGLASALGSVSGLRTYNYQPEQLNPPIAFPVLNQINYHRAMQGGDVVMDWTVSIIVGRYVDRTAISLLDEYLSFSGTKSIRAALESDRTLGGVCQTLIVGSAADISSLSSAEAEFLQIQFTVQVHG